MISPLPAKGRQLVAAAAAFVGAIVLADRAFSSNSIMTPMADGFDYPVGFPDGYGYYKARGYQPNGHQGEDWNGRGGGNSDLGDPIYAAAHGVVVFSDDYKLGWGNVIIIRHAYRSSSGQVNYIDSLYGHLDKRNAQLHDLIRRGQKIGTMGTNRGMYMAHLHFEIRKNINIGMARSRYAQDFSNYYSPSNFIADHRSLRKEFRPQRIPVDNFHTGAKNYQQGHPLESLPKLPTTDESAPVIDIDDELREILERHNLMRAPAKSEKEASQPPRTMFGGEARPERTEDSPENRESRDNIRSFWNDFRDTIREEQDDSPLPPEEP